MSEVWLMTALTDYWPALAGIYLLGIGTGWVIWGGANISDKTASGENSLRRNATVDLDDGDSNSSESFLTADAPVAMKIDALAAELANAKKLLGANGDEQENLTEIVSSLDDAVKRANGRLKLLTSAVKRRKS